MKKPSVLVLDDDEDNVLILEAALQTSGYDVRHARSCAEAQAMLTGGTADALVTDLRLGDGTAYDLVAALGKKRPRVAVLVTGFGSPEDKQASAEAGFQAHLVKPVTLELLERTLRRALEAASIPPSSQAPGRA